MVTEKIENALQEIEEIKRISSASQAGWSAVYMQLEDNITAVDEVWSRVRDKVSEVEPELPPSASVPEFNRPTTARLHPVGRLYLDHQRSAATGPAEPSGGKSAPAPDSSFRHQGGRTLRRAGGRGAGRRRRRRAGLGRTDRRRGVGRHPARRFEERRRADRQRAQQHRRRGARRNRLHRSRSRHSAAQRRRRPNLAGGRCRRGDQDAAFAAVLGRAGGRQARHHRRRQDREQPAGRQVGRVGCGASSASSSPICPTV